MHVRVKVYVFATFQALFSTLHPAFSTLWQMPDDGRERPP
jgi:hypothetical protein